MSKLRDLDNLQVPPELPFPAVTKQVAGVVNGIQTDVTCVQFSDKILVTISQNGRLGHWVRCSASPPTRLQANHSSAACTARE